MSILQIPRRGMMGGAGGGLGRYVTVQSAIANGAQVVTVFNALPDKATTVGCYITTVPQSEWGYNQLVMIVSGGDGNVIAAFRYRGSVVSFTLESNYDVVSTANTDYYLVEAL